MLFNPLFLFQGPTTQATDTTNVIVKSHSLVDIIIGGGPLGILNTLTVLLLGVIAVYIFIERYLTIKRAGEVDQNFMNQIRTYVQSAKVGEAKSLCDKTDTPVARLVAKGLDRIGRPLEDISAAVINVANLEVYKMEKNLSILATISGAAPMIGFLGTVTGMIQSFMTMAEGDVSTAGLANGIYQALITTAFGLVVGIIAFIGYNSLIALMDRVVFKMEAATLDFLDLLQEPA